MTIYNSSSKKSGSSPGLYRHMTLTLCTELHAGKININKNKIEIKIRIKKHNVKLKV